LRPIFKLAITKKIKSLSLKHIKTQRGYTVRKLLMIPLLIGICFQASTVQAGFFKKLGKTVATAKIAFHYSAGAVVGACVGAIGANIGGEAIEKIANIDIAGCFITPTIMGAGIGAISGIIAVAAYRAIASKLRHFKSQAAADFKDGYNNKI